MTAIFTASAGVGGEVDRSWESPATLPITREKRQKRTIVKQGLFSKSIMFTILREMLFLLGQADESTEKHGRGTSKGTLSNPAGDGKPCKNMRCIRRYIRTTQRISYGAVECRILIASMGESTRCERESRDSLKDLKDRTREGCTGNGGILTTSWNPSTNA